MRSRTFYNLEQHSTILWIIWWISLFSQLQISYQQFITLTQLVNHTSDSSPPNDSSYNLIQQMAKDSVRVYAYEQTFWTSIGGV